MIKGLPDRLRHVRGVGIYSPSGSVDDPEKLQLFEAGLEYLRQAGLEVVESTHCRGSWHHASGSPRERVDDLRELLQAPEVDLIVPSIGGHVASQLLPLLDVDEIAASGKALLGFSDNAVLPLIVAAGTGVVTVHHGADVTFGFGKFAEGLYQLSQRSFAEAIVGRFDLNGSGRWRPMQPGTGTGRLLGGNLKGLAALAGTRWWPDWSGAILFWESTDPRHAVLQQLVQLSYAGAFDDLAGMVIGRVSTLSDSFYPTESVLPIEELLLDVLRLRDRFPIVVEADLGHNVDNVAVPVGATATLDVSGDSITCRVDTH